jgi:signal peptide peptidase SppA
VKYQHIARYLASQIWAIEPSKLHELLAVLAFRAAGHTFTAEEIQARIGDGGRAASASSRGKVAIIPVRGVIANRMGSMDDSSGGTSCERIAAMIDQVAADPSVSTIVYDFDTPGGTVTGLETLAAKMFALRGVKQQIAMVGGMCASAGYWLASQCDEIVSVPDGEIGSIGCRWTPHQDLSGALEKEGIKITEIYSGKYKTEWNPFEAPSAEAIAVRQAQSDMVYGKFKAAVARGRGVTAAAVERGYGQGRLLFATDAKAAGMIDSIGTLDSVVARYVGGRGTSGALAARATAPDPHEEAFRRRLLAPAAHEEAEAAEAEAALDRLRAARLL